MTDQIETHGPDTLKLSLNEAVMMTEQMQTRFHRRKDLVDRCLPGVVAFDPEGPGGFVGEQNIDIGHALARLDLCADEMSSSVRELGRFRRPLLRMWQLFRRHVVHRRRVRATKTRNTNAFDHRRRAVRDEMKVRRQIAAGDSIEVLVVALDPEEWCVERLVMSVAVGNIADTKPIVNLGMLPHDTADGHEIAMDIAKCPDHDDQ